MELRGVTQSSEGELRLLKTGSGLQFNSLSTSTLTNTLSWIYQRCGWHWVVSFLGSWSQEEQRALGDAGAQYDVFVLLRHFRVSFDLSVVVLDPSVWLWVRLVNKTTVHKSDLLCRVSRCWTGSRLRISWDRDQRLWDWCWVSSASQTHNVSPFTVLLYSINTLLNVHGTISCKWSGLVQVSYI